MMRISPARAAAYEVLLRIERDRAFSSVLLPQYEVDLIEKDAALCHQIVLGVLRRKLFLDAKIQAFTPIKKLDVEVLTALRIGAYQLLELDRIPDHSAVNESVMLVQRARKASAKGLVNAVLRKIAAARGSGTDTLDLSIELSHPQWLLDRWAAEFGPERASAIARSNNSPSRLAFRLTGEGRGPSTGTKSEIVDGAFTVPNLDRDLREYASKGEIYFQDEASQLIANMVSIPAGGRFLDVCAAPGSKTSQIAIRHDPAGVTIAAGDLNLRRVEFLRSNCLRQGVTSVLTVQYDAEHGLPFEEGSFDSVLVDAPCSGTGTIASNPEIRYSLEPDDVLQLSRKQLRILENASKLVKSGGRLYYSTCSLERVENEEVIANFLAGSNGFSVRADGIDPRFRTDEGFGRTFPDRDGTDGFFVALLEKG